MPSLPVPDFEAAAFSTASASVEERAKELSKRLTSLLHVLEEIRAHGPQKALALGEKSSTLGDVATQLAADGTGFFSKLAELQEQITAWRSGERRSRRSRFEEIARHLQWKILGSWPEPVINGIVFITIDEPKDRATVNGRAISGIPTAERIVEAADADLRELQQNLTEPTAFIEQVWKAYAARIETPGTGVGVQEMLAELAWRRQSKAFHKDPRSDLFRGYPLSQFRADLTNYLSNGAPHISDKGKSHELQIAGGSFAQDGVFMYFPQTDRLGTCGRLTFQAVDRDSQ